jgi:hypothetical protein
VNAAALQPSIAPLITGDIVTHFMGYAVYLNHQAGLPAEEVEDVGIHRMLAAKLETIGALPKLQPQQSLR